MKDPAQCVKDRLVAQGVGTFGASTGWSIAIGRLPDKPDTVILVNATGGQNPFPHLLLNFPSVQVFVRGTKNGYQEARTKAYDVVKALLGMTDELLQGDMYRSCTQIGDIAYLGQDENTRPMFSANFSFIVEPAQETGDIRVPIT